MVKIAFLTIGQSPRIDIMRDIKSLLPSNIEIIEVGALDNLNEKEINFIAPSNNKEKEVLVSRLRNGKQVLIDRRKLIPLIKKCIKNIENHVDGIVLLCTDDFPEINSKKILIKPYELLNSFVSIIDGKILGIVVPIKEQINFAKKRWSKIFPKKIIIHSYSPYTNEEIKMEDFEDFKFADLIVLDCIGYTIKHKIFMYKTFKKPILLPRTLIARTINEIYCSEAI
ncbi:MAG: AroM family protein [Nitrososphaerota archaeon]